MSDEESASESYVIDRHAIMLPPRALTWAHSATWPQLNAPGETHFIGQTPMLTWFWETPDGKRNQLELPQAVVMTQPRYYSFDPSGRYLFVIGGEPEQEAYLMRVDRFTKTSLTLHMPSINSATPIKVSRSPTALNAP